MEKVRAFVVVLGLCAALLGCKSDKEVVMDAMGDAAPAYGTDGKTNMQTFPVGRWCVIDSMEGKQPHHYYEFAADGTFKCGEKDWTSTGKWTVSGEQLVLSYLTMEGKPYEEFRAQYKKGEEGGTQVAVARALKFDGVYDSLGKLNGVWVDKDKKHLIFAPPQASPAAGQTGGDNPLAGMEAMMKGDQLERMGPKKD